MKKTITTLWILFFVVISIKAQDRIIITNITYDTIACKALFVKDSSFVYSNLVTDNIDTIAFAKISKCFFTAENDFLVVPRVVYDTIIGTIESIDNKKVEVIIEDGSSKSFLKRETFLCQFEESPYQENITVFRENNRFLPYSTIRLVDNKAYTVKGTKIKAKLIAVDDDEVTVTIHYREKLDTVISRKENILFIQFNAFYFDEEISYTTDYFLSKQGNLFSARLDKIEHEKISIKKRDESNTAVIEERKSNISGIFFIDFSAQPPNNVRYNRYDFSTAEFSFGGGFANLFNASQSGPFGHVSSNIYLFKNFGWGLSYKYLKTEGSFRYLGSASTTTIHNHFLGTSIIYRARLSNSFYNKIFVTPTYLFMIEKYKDADINYSSFGISFSDRISLESRHGFGGYLEFSYLVATESMSAASKNLSRIEIGIGIMYSL